MMMMKERKMTKTIVFVASFGLETRKKQQKQ